MFDTRTVLRFLDRRQILAGTEYLRLFSKQKIKDQDALNQR